MCHCAYRAIGKDPTSLQKRNRLIVKMDQLTTLKLKARVIATGEAMHQRRDKTILADRVKVPTYREPHELHRRERPSSSTLESVRIPVVGDQVVAQGHLLSFVSLQHLQQLAHVAPDFEFIFVTDAASFINSSSVRLTRCESSTSVWQVQRDHPSRISPPTAVIRRAMPNCCDAGGVVEGTFARWRRDRGSRRVRAR